MALSGRNGAECSIAERWALVPLRSSWMPEFIRKIQTAGVLHGVVSTECEAQVRKFMEGVYLVTLIRRGGDAHEIGYTLRYSISNGFAAGEEFWNFDFDSPTNRFAYTFDFAAECAPKEFRAVYRDGSNETSLTPTVSEGDRVTYRVTAMDVPSGTAIAFKWRWPVDSAPTTSSPQA
jgi:hypothetical protein